jgi:capsular polysaccharide biosynthesis protein
VTDRATTTGPVASSSLIALLGRWWRTLLLAAALAGVGGYLAAATTATHQASVRVLVGPVVADAATLRAASQLAQTYAELARTKPLMEATAAELDAGRSAGRLRRATTVTADTETRLLTISVTDGDPDIAADAANEIARQLTELGRTSRTVRAGELLVVDAADPGSTSLTPPPFLYALVAAGAAALLTVAAAAALDGARRIAHDEDELRAAGGTTSSFRLALGPQPRVLDPTLQRIAAHVLGPRPDATRTVLVTGVEGARLDDVAEALAGAFCVLGRDVRIVIEDGTHVPPRALLGGGQVETVPLPAVEDRIGARTSLTGLTSDVDVVLLVASSTGGSATPVLWAPCTSGVVLVAGLGVSRLDDVRSSADALQLAGGEVLGIVGVEHGRRRSWRHRDPVADVAREDTAAAVAS